LRRFALLRSQSSATPIPVKKDLRDPRDLRENQRLRRYGFLPQRARSEFRRGRRVFNILYFSVLYVKLRRFALLRSQSSATPIPVKKNLRNLRDLREKQRLRDPPFFQLVSIFSMELRSFSDNVSISERACSILVLKFQQVIWRRESRRPNS
jgi:hypothetical protein